MTAKLKRREFISLLGGAAAAWPLAVRAQQVQRVRRIGVLIPFTADDPEAQARMLAFAQGLQSLGWTVGDNLRIDIRWSAGYTDRSRRYAAELLALGAEVILANAGGGITAGQEAARSGPIVFANGGGPGGLGVVASLARPGGDVPGVYSRRFGQSGKWR